MQRRARVRLLITGIATSIALVALPGAPADASRAPSVPELQTCTADAELALGSFGESVSCLQSTLGLMGIYHGRITGIYDQVTSDSVRWFQLTETGLRADGVAGPNTLTALEIWSGVTNPPPPPPCAAAANVELGESGPDVTCLQSTLRNLGLLVGEVDGAFGPGTLAAVTRYQENNPPLVPDGIAGPRTLAAMGIWNGMNENSLVGNGSQYNTGGVGPSGPAGPGPWPAPMMALPEYRLTPEGIPYYGNRGICSRAQADVIAAQFANDGADIETQQWAVWVASREGGCNHLIVNYNLATRDDSHCTFQLNVLSNTFESWGELGRRGWTPESVKSSLEACADAASDLWVYCGRGPWTPPYYCRPPWQGATPNGSPVAVPVATTTTTTTTTTTAPPAATPTTRPPRSTTSTTSTTRPPRSTTSTTPTTRPPRSTTTTTQPPRPTATVPPTSAPVSATTSVPSAPATSAP
jgi:peptidoglycan hydrolase-like protein with peptidoglycan-binding domain